MAEIAVGDGAAGKMAVQTLATAATIGTVKTTIQTLLAALKTKGLMATS